jgi:hypothetical protein
MTGTAGAYIDERYFQLITDFVFYNSTMLNQAISHILSIKRYIANVGSAAKKKIDFDQVLECTSSYRHRKIYWVEK